MSRIWHLISGEYPPQVGGVGDYTSALGRALADDGAEVHVWCRGEAQDPSIEQGGVVVHRVAGRFGPSGLRRLGRCLDRYPHPRTILIQYSPSAFGWKAMNLAFVAWVQARRVARGDDIRVMFHEVAFPWSSRVARHNILAAVHRLMAAVLIRSSTGLCVSTAVWTPLLRRLGARRIPILWTPIPSNIPGDVATPSRAWHRAGFGRGQADVRVVGHFGTYGVAITESLGAVLRDMLGRRENLLVVLLGLGGDRWRSELVAGRDDWARRVIAPGSLPSTEIAAHLRSCDLAIQPYPDGVTGRRTTIMAALINEVPVITNTGHLTEAYWEDSPVVTVPVGEPIQMATRALELLDSPSRLTAMGLTGRQFYEDRFALRHTIAALQSSAPGRAVEP